MLPKARLEGLIVEPVELGVVVHDPARGRSWALRPAAERVWRESNGKRSVRRIAGLVARRLHVAPDPAMVLRALQQLSAAGLLEPGPIAAAGVRASVRRDLVRPVTVVETASSADSPPTH